MKRECTVLFVGMLVFVGLVALVGFIAVNAADTPAPQQLPGEHSTLTTQDGSIRDDKLADYVASQVPKDASGNPQVKDVKIMFNSCYGGGMLDDFERVFGPGGACEGVPWVGGTASKPDECAWGHSDESVNAKPGKNLGSCWTDALHPGIRDGGNVLDGFNNAAQTDAAGPNGAGLETPVTASGNGGENIRWDAPGTKHRAVVFGGDNTNLRHDNNIENVGDALGDAWANSDGYSIYYGWGDPDDGTTQDLKDMISAACSGLDKNTELVLYFDDHGNTEFDIDEYLAWLLETVLPGEPLVITEPLVVEFPLHAGWVQGLSGMADQPGDEPMPTLNLVLLEPIHSSEWEIFLNEVPVLLDEGWLAGDVELSIDWTSIREGYNLLEIIPYETCEGCGRGPEMVLENLELSSGPINEIEGEYPDAASPGKTHTYGDTEGWYMVSVPLNSGSASSLFGAVAYRWNCATGVYDLVSVIEPKFGYWVSLPANKSVTDSGGQVTSDVTINISCTGWHQVSAPWSYPKSAIQVIKGATTKTWADAVAAGWVRDAIYGYKATDGAYNTPSTLDPWYGYWVRAEVSGLSLKLNYASGTPVSATFAPMAPKALVVPADLPPMPPSPSVGAADLEFGNYPNPVTDVYTTTFAVKGAAAAYVEAIKVRIFDLAGRLVYEAEEAGTSLDWHTDSDYGEYLANGVYLYKLYALVNGEWVVSDVRKLAILR